MVQRKPSNVLTRKPFLDRTVNSKSPDPARQKSNVNLTNGTASVEKSKVSPKIKENFNEPDFTYSFKEVEGKFVKYINYFVAFLMFNVIISLDDCEDVWPRSELFGRENRINICRNYCSVEDTPPPSPVRISPIFFDLPKFELPDFQLEEFLDETIDIEVPSYVDDSELNFSID